MSKFRFTGAVKEIKYNAKGKGLGLVPDQECAANKDIGENTIKYAVFLPFDATSEGIVFAYEGSVEIAMLKNAKWLPSWKVGGQYAFVLEGVADATKGEIEVKNAPSSKYFRIESVAEKA